jgi:hypothetical protein
LSRDMATAKRQNEVVVNTGYAQWQIAKALRTAEAHEDADTRNRAQQKADKWDTVLAGLLSGANRAGSRTPFKDTPAWATLEVVTGGFATGNLLAGGPLLDHEVALATSLGLDTKDRTELNKYFITDDGMARLQTMLDTECYDINIPEEGALLTVAWLLKKGEIGRARNVLEEIAPWFPRLRFYPVPTESPRRVGSQVSLQTVTETVGVLNKIRPNERIIVQKETIETWLPIYDKIVSLFLETVEGKVPNLKTKKNGTIELAENGAFPVTGGWPCKTYPDGWFERAKVLLDEFESKKKVIPVQMPKKRDRYSYARYSYNKPEARGKSLNPKSSLYQIRELLEQCVRDPKALTGRDVGKIRLILARYIWKHGTPKSAKCKSFRTAQAASVDKPTYQEISKVVVNRLSKYPGNEGIDDVSAVLDPITPAEESVLNVQADAQVPDYIRKKVVRCLRDTINVLVEKGIITSGEVLGKVLPQITSEVKAACIDEPVLRNLYASVYRAFRRRRSLLLLNLESQVRLEELPWISAVDTFRDHTPTTVQLSKKSLEEVSTLAITSFPETILPNKLLQEMKALVKSSELTLPIVEEVAADIFMGTFTDKFLNAAKMTSGLLKDTLYTQYYGIDCGGIEAVPTNKPQKSGAYSYRGRGNDKFAAVCRSRAGLRGEGGWRDTASNGMIIEQEQILTSHNLGALFSELGLSETIGKDRLVEMAKECFVWICKRLQVHNNEWHDKLIQLKVSAYAWRQMVFYLSLINKTRLRGFITWANKHLSAQPEWFRLTFTPIFDGLKKTIKTGEKPQIQFLGWTKGKNHWFLQNTK